MFGFFRNHKPPLILILVLFLAIIVVFVLNYFFYSRINKEVPKENPLEAVEENKIDYKEIEKTLTAPEGPPTKLSDEELKRISAPKSDKPVEVSKEVLDSLTAPN